MHVYVYIKELIFNLLLLSFLRFAIKTEHKKKEKKNSQSIKQIIK
jgi:hypothetical protein